MIGFISSETRDASLNWIRLTKWMEEPTVIWG